MGFPLLRDDMKECLFVFEFFILQRNDTESLIVHWNGEQCQSVIDKMSFFRKLKYIMHYLNFGTLLLSNLRTRLWFSNK